MFPLEARFSIWLDQLAMLCKKFPAIEPLAKTIRKTVSDWKGEGIPHEPSAAFSNFEDQLYQCLRKNTDTSGLERSAKSEAEFFTDGSTEELEMVIRLLANEEWGLPDFKRIRGDETVTAVA